MRAQPRWGVLPLLAAPVGTTWALGLGDIELQSALNQPFQAQIALVSPTADELASLTVTLASSDTFERYGLDRPGFLSDFSFRIGRNNQGQDVIIVSSRLAVSEPFVTLLVEAAWPNGRSLREYTVLLDPPLLLPEPGVAEPVRPAQARAPEPAVAGGPIQRPAPQAPAPAVSPPPAAAPAPAPRPAPVSTGGIYGPVQRAETLWAIAGSVQPGGVTRNQMMVAIYEANPQAFDSNMNWLLRGAVLRIPELGEVQSRTSAEATAEVQRQTDAWQGTAEQRARLRLVAPADDPLAGLGAQGDGAQTAANEAELRTLRSDVSNLQAELEESRRLLELRNQELLDLQNQLAEARRQGETPVPAPAPGPAVVDPGVELEPEPAQLFADEPAEVAPPAPSLPAAATTPAEPSLVSRVLEFVMTPMALIGLGVGALLLTALLFLRRRSEDVEDVTGRWEALEAEADAEDEEIAATTRLRKRAQPDEDRDFVVVEQSPAADDDDDMAAALLGDDDEFEAFETSEIEAPRAAAPEPETEPEASEETLSSQTVINLDQADPVAEADFHMAYGLYDQAAELVSKALRAKPDSRSLKLKLLEVFFVWGNRESFLEAAQALRAEMGERPDGDWDKVIIMGKQICPDEPLFADATAAAGEVDLDLDAAGGPDLDLAFEEQGDVGADSEAGIDLDFSDEQEEAADELRLEATGNRAAMMFDDSSDAGSSGEVDLDIGARTSAGLEAALFGDDSATATTPDLDSLAETQESPTVETTGPDSDTVEMAAADTDAESPTVESPTVETDLAMSAELPTVEQPGLQSGADMTAELELDDLGLDVKDLEALPSDLGDLPGAEDADADTREQPSLGADDEDDLLSATGVTQVLRGDEEGLQDLSSSVLDDDDATMLAPGLGDDSMTSSTLTGTEVLEHVEAEDEDTQRGRGIDLNLDDLSDALAGGATVEQPRVSRSFAGDVFGGGGETPVDLDVGADILGSEDPTSTEEVTPLDPQTMTEVGTKLDLARAYIDMGDPEGARSILEEVLDEGDSGQRREAQTLMEVLSA